MTPRALELRSLALHSLAVEKVRRDPALFDRVRTTNARFLNMRRDSAVYSRRWQDLIDAGSEPCLRKAVEDSEEAADLRQASPFAGILNEEERRDFLRHWAQTRETPRT